MNRREVGLAEFEWRGVDGNFLVEVASIVVIAALRFAGYMRAWLVCLLGVGLVDWVRCRR